MPTLEQRFWSKVDKNGPVPAHRPDLGPCWLWTASLDRHGYGQLRVGSRVRRSHHISCELMTGALPSGFEHDHLCRVRRCVNVAHLEPVAHATNIRRGHAGIARGLQLRAKTHCPQGHPYSGDNLYVDTAGRRNCRICKRENLRRSRARRRAA